MTGATDARRELCRRNSERVDASHASANADRTYLAELGNQIAECKPHRRAAGHHRDRLTARGAVRRADRMNPETELPMPSTYTLRPADATESQMLTELAQLDSAKPLDGDVLIAFAAERPAAAMSLRDGRIIADPFMCTTDAVELLRLYARRSHRPRARARAWRRLQAANAATGS